MQQVAAQKTDIAALPFSASSTAKAVESGIGTQQHANSDNKQAFNRLYQDAKSTKSDFVLNENGNRRNEESVEVKRDASASSNAVAPARAVKDDEPGHTHLPENDDSPSPSPETSNKATIDRNERHTNGDEESHEADTIVEEEGSVKQKDATETVHVIGEGGKKDAEAGVITTPGSPDAKPDKAENSEPDWIAFVETVANRLNKDESSTSRNNVGGATEIIAGEAAEVISVKEAGKLWKLPEHVDAKDAPSILTHLLSQLSSDSEAKNISVASLSDEAKEALGALTSLLFGGNSDNENIEFSDTTASGDSASSQGENTLKALIAQLVNTQSNEGSEQAEPSLDKGEGNTDTSATAQESLVLSLIADELDSAQSSSLADIVTKAQDMLSSASGTVSTTDKASAVSTSGASPSSEVTMKGETTLSDTEFANTQTPADLLNAISELSPQSAQKATEAFAERMVATVPSGQQQQAVKSNIIAGINEFQQQVQQGREPGIDLSTIVADAAKEASVSSEVAAAMTARVDSQASQFLNLMTQTQASAQHAIAGLINQTDTVMQENNQLRTEASKTQQQFEGFDKAVNIHKSEGQQQLNEKIRWMVNARNTMAEIRLDPPELGSMQVRVNVSGEAASVSFVVQSQQAKDALADAMPKLRDMLAEQGIELGDAQVRKDNSSGNENGQQLAGENKQGHGDGNRGENDGSDDLDGTRVIEQSVTRASKGGIDFYA